MYDFIEEYPSYIITGMIILSIGTIFIFSGENRAGVKNLPIQVNESSTKQNLDEVSILVKESTILSGSTENRSEQIKIAKDPKNFDISEANFTVTRVIDGDTIDIGLDANIRILGIDAPESSSIRYGHTECDGKLASAYARDILLGKQIRIEKDTIQPERDKYGRYLLHIWIDDQLFSEKIISDGYAKQYTKVLNKYSSLIASSEIIARSRNRGLWGDCK